MEICIKWNICRLCLQEEEKSSTTSANSIQQTQHLFMAEKNFALHIYKLCGITMQPGDSLPEKICNRCVSSLDKAIQFRKTCRASDIYLHSILDRTKSASTLFKPDIETYQVSDDELDVGSVEKQPSSLFHNEIKSNKFETQNENIAAQLLNKEHQNAGSIQNLEQQEKFVEKEVTQIIATNKMEVEVIIDLSDELENTLEDIRREINLQPRCTTEYNIENSNIKSCQTSEIEKVHMNANFSTLKNNSERYDNDNDVVEIVETENNGGKKKSFSNNNENHSFKQFELSTSDEEFLDEDVKKVEGFNESLLTNLKKNINDNESSASSIVNTNNQNKYYENNSNPKNHLDEGCLIDGNLTTGNISITKPSKDFSKTNLHINNFSTDTANDLYICHICGDDFTTQTQMNDHIQIHLQDKKYQCQLCCKRYSASFFPTHMRTHTGEKPYECQYCGKRFNYRRLNIRHERIHTKEKPYECAECGKRFCTSPNFRAHKKTHQN